MQALTTRAVVAPVWARVGRPPHEYAGDPDRDVESAELLNHRGQVGHFCWPHLVKQPTAGRRVKVFLMNGEFGAAVQREGPQGLDTAIVPPMVMDNLEALMGQRESIKEQMENDLDRPRQERETAKAWLRIKAPQEASTEVAPVEPEPLTHLRKRTKGGTTFYCGVPPESEVYLLNADNLVVLGPRVPVCDPCGRQAQKMSPLSGTQARR